MLDSGWGLQGLSPSSVATQVQWASGSGAGSDKASRVALYHLKTLSRVNPCCRREALTSAALAPPVSAPSWRLTGGRIHNTPGEGDNLGEPNARNKCHVFACLTECGVVSFAQRWKSESCVMIPLPNIETLKSPNVIALSRLGGLREPTQREEQAASCSTGQAKALDMMGSPKQLLCLSLSIPFS